MDNNSQAQYKKRKLTRFLVHSAVMTLLLLAGPVLIVLASFFGGDITDGFMGSHSNTEQGNMLLQASVFVTLFGSVGAIIYASVCSALYYKEDKRYILALILCITLPIILIITSFIINYSVGYCTQHPRDCLSY